MVSAIQIIAIIGYLVSLYSFYVEKKSKSKDYKALCDINDKMSCTKAFSSKYGKLFMVSNSTMGIVFYFIVFLLAYFNQINYVFYLSVLAIIGSICLAYLLYFKVKTICIVCTGIYLVNILLVIFSYRAI